MTDDPVDLDEYRGMAAQNATEVRRQFLRNFQADHAALRRRREEPEKLLLAAPAETWPVQLFASTSQARNPRSKELIAHTLDDLNGLSDRAQARS